MAANTNQKAEQTSDLGPFGDLRSWDFSFFFFFFFLQVIFSHWQNFLTYFKVCKTYDRICVGLLTFVLET